MFLCLSYALKAAPRDFKLSFFKKQFLPASLLPWSYSLSHPRSGNCAVLIMKASLYYEFASVVWDKFWQSHILILCCIYNSFSEPQRKALLVFNWVVCLSIYFAFQTFQQISSLALLDFVVGRMAITVSALCNLEELSFWISKFFTNAPSFVCLWEKV